MLDDLASYGFTREAVIPEGTIKLVITLREAPRMANSDQLPCGELPVNIQQSPRHTTVKGPKSYHVHSLLDNEVPNYSGDGPSPRKTVGLKRML